MIDVFQAQKQLERSSGVVVATLRDEAGVAVPLATMTTLTLTLRDQATRAIVNTRDRQNVLNANNVTFGATDGLVTWAVQPADLECVSGGNEEVRRALFTARWSGGSREHSWVILIPIENAGPDVRGVVSTFLSGGL